jgi:hypothetical protein
MNRWGLILLVTCVVAAGCGDDDNPSAPSSASLVFSAMLSPANEVPPVGNAEGGGRGAAQISFDGSRATIYFQLTGFPADTRVVGAHIHSAGPGVNGPIVVNTGISATSPVVLSGGTAEFVARDIAVDPALVQSIANNPLGFYFNVHSPLNPGGFARGQLVQVR